MLAIMEESLLYVPCVFSRPQAVWGPELAEGPSYISAKSRDRAHSPPDPVTDLYRFQQDECAVGVARGGGSPGISHILFL